MITGSSLTKTISWVIGRQALNDDKGSFGIYSNADPISFQTFKYKVEDSKIYIYDVFPKGKSPYYLDCKISNNKLKIENGEESGTYEKLEY